MVFVYFLSVFGKQPIDPRLKIKNGKVRSLDLKALFEAFGRKKKVVQNCDVDPQLFINRVTLLENMKMSSFCYVKEDTALFKSSYFVLCPFTSEALELLIQATLKPLVKVTNGFGFVSFIAGSLETANWSILAARNLFKDFGGGKKSGFYDN